MSLCGCVSGERGAQAAYAKALSAQRTGDFSLSLTRAQEALRRWPDGDWGWKFRLLNAEDLIRLGHSPAALQLLENAGTPSNAGLQAQWILDRAWVSMGSEPEKARLLLQQAREIALKTGDRTLTCTIGLRLGELAPDFSEGETCYRAALSDAEGLRDPYLITWARMGLGFNRARAARFDEAIPFLEQAYERAQQCGAQSLITTTLGNLGWCHFALGDLDRAINELTRAEALSAKIGTRDLQQRWLGEIGNIYMDRGDLDRAAGYQQRALELAQAVGNVGWVAIALNNLALIALKKGDLDAARSFNDRALVIKRRLKNPWSLAYSELNGALIEARERKYPQAEAAYRAVIRKAPEANAPDVLWGAYAGLGDLYRESRRPKLAEAEYRKAIDTIDREWSKLGSDDVKTTFLAPNHLIELFQDYVGFLIENGQTRRALEIAESSRARVLSQKVQSASALPPEFRMDKLVAAARESNTVILSYWLAPGHSAVWAIGAAGASYRALPSRDEIARLVEKHTGIITQGGDPLADRGAASSALYQAVLAPVHKLVPPGSNVIIVPDGALHQLSFGTLIVPDPQPHYWIEDVALATAPSLRVLRDGRRGPPRTARLLLLGDPVLTGHDFGPLPAVKREIAAVEEHFPAAKRVVFTGAEAVPARYAQAVPADFTNIHFATHATANLESPLNSAIILSRQGDIFKLYARDVAAVPLKADLVTISACKSAGAKAYSGEGLMGFAWAFLQSGAQNVIATLWDEDDDASVALMRSLYTEMAAGQTPARALRSAKLALMHSGSHGRLPYYWGPLQVFTRQIAAPSPAAR